MKKVLKITGIISVLVFLLLLAGGVLFDLWQSGSFNRRMPREIASYQSPDGQYVLIFDQLGDPVWPFGPTDVRLTLKTSGGKKIGSVDTFLQDDGANAGPYNIRQIDWQTGSVTVTLGASEMEDQSVTIPYS